MPESPRWLAVHARFDELIELLQKVCRTNKLQLPPDFNAKCLVDDIDKVYIYISRPLYCMLQVVNIDNIAYNFYEHRSLVCRSH